MRLKSFIGLVIVAFIITTFYLVVIRGRSRHSDFDHQHSAERPESTVRERSEQPLGPQRTAGYPRHAERSLKGSPGLSCSSKYFSSWTEPTSTSCRIRLKDGYPVPDPRCTPGGINPSVSLDVLRDPRWRTHSNDLSGLRINLLFVIVGTSVGSRNRRWTLTLPEWCKRTD